MYTRVQRNGRSVDNSSAKNPFAPRPFKVDESLPQKNLNEGDAIQSQELSPKRSNIDNHSFLSRISLLRPDNAPPFPSPGIQMKLGIGDGNRENALTQSSLPPIEELQGALGNRAVNQLLVKQPILLTHNVQQQEKTKELIIQRAGETEAAQYTADLEIRRGNRRGSIVDTNGFSQSELIFVRNFTDEIINEVETQLNKDLQSNPRLKTQVEKALKNRNRMEIYVAELIRVGNCGEFAQMVFWHIVENAKDTWVYEASMQGHTKTIQNYDHAFNITYDKEIKNSKGFDLKKATVVDAWNNYTVQTLEHFLAHNNPYGTRLHKENIKIHSCRKAEGKEILGDHIKNVILDKAQIVYNREQVNIGAYAKQVETGNSEGIFDFTRTDRSIDDTRRI